MKNNKTLLQNFKEKIRGFLETPCFRILNLWKRTQKVTNFETHKICRKRGDRSL